MSEGKDHKEEKDYKEDDGNDAPAPREFSWMPAGHEALADGEYDAIVLGTGLTECIISGLLSVQGKRVLHLDRNNYYGADTASLSLQNLFQKFEKGSPPSALGPSRGRAIFDALWLCVLCNSSLYRVP